MWSTIADFSALLYHSQNVSLGLDKSRVLIIFLEDQSRGNVVPFLDHFGLALEDHQDQQSGELPRYGSRVTHTTREFWARTKTHENIPDWIIQGLDQTIGVTLEAIAPVYQFPDHKGRDGIISPLPSVLLLRKQPNLSAIQERDLDEAIGGYGLKDIASISRFLSFHKHCVLAEPIGRSTYDLLKRIPHDIPDLVRVASIHPKRMLSNHAAIPKDRYYQPGVLGNSYKGQWNLVKINAGSFAGAATTGWDKTPLQGRGVLVGVIDCGVDYAHEEFMGRIGVRGDPISATEAHGTACAGVIGATSSWGMAGPGVAGIAGNCTFISKSLETTFGTLVAPALNDAREDGARVINMSFGWTESDLTSAEKEEMEAALTSAYDAGIILCASAGNHEAAELLYPAKASNYRVIACGATNESDQRCTEADWNYDSGGKPYRSNFGKGLSVVAPGVHIPTTDISGPGGYVPPGPDPDYAFNFWGTSAATAHVSGLAALLLGEYPGLTPAEIRTIIEKTADQVGGYFYDPALSVYPGRGWNSQMGNGRINVLTALLEAPNYSADMFIKDYPGDSGAVPSTPPGGNFWEFSDIVVHSINDVAAGSYTPGTFDPSDVLGSSTVRQGVDNYLFIRVTNNGPSPARNVAVDARIVPYPGLEFSPSDWVITDATHLRPFPTTATFSSIPAAASFIATFTIPASQVNTAWGWQGNALGWHPCILASVRADNDYGFPAMSTPSLQPVLDFNNLAQRNLSILSVPAMKKSKVQFPFVLSNSQETGGTVEVVIDIGLPGNIDHQLTVVAQPHSIFHGLTDITHIESLQVRGNGSTHDHIYHQTAPITHNPTVVKINPLGPRMQGQHYVLTISVSVPANLHPGTQYPIRIHQRNQEQVVTGGATAILFAQ